MNQQSSTKCPQEKVCGYEYTVRRGDSFYLIANRLGVPLRDLLEANSEINPARLMVGDVLCIPMEEDDKPSAPVQPEPTLPAEPAPETPAQPAPPIQPDDLDAPATLPEAAPLPDPAAVPGETASPAETPAVCPEANRHTLLPGETAADLLLRANINLHTLQVANPTTDLHRLTAGQTLCVPTENIPCGIPATYTLQTDETLESVALRLNASLSALLHANPCLAPGDFKAGACIYVPED